MLLNCLLRRRCARLSALLLALSAAPWAHATSPVAHPAAPASPLARAASAASAVDADSDDSGNLSASARRIYEFGRPRLLQVRTLLRDQDSQASVGSGSLVGPDGLILTNYHVVSQVALEPQRYRLNFQTVDGVAGALQLIAFDVVHDLALVRMAKPPAAVGSRGVFEFRPAATPLAQGERIFSLGNPLDVGFAVVEGTYNGLVERSFLPQILFSGSLNPGMSGGPVLDDRGHIVGVNVATRRDGQQISFLVPAEFAQALIARGANAKPITGPVEAEMARQLLQHQQQLTRRFVALPWRETKHAHYSVPVPQEDFMRCWGSSNPSESKGLSFERSDCQMDTAIFINESLRTGDMAVRHEVYDGSKLGALRFAEEAGQSFRNEGMGRRTRDLTAPKCQEDFVESGGLPMRTVMCLRAYRRLPGLYDVAVLSQSVDAKTEGVQGRFDARGVSFDNAMLLATHYLKGIRMETLALIEALDRDGQPRQILRVSQWPVRIGRAIDCDLVLDDPHVAALHATLDMREDGLHVVPAATVNGVRLGRATVAPGSAPLLPASGQVTLGATTLRVRLASEVLAPEQRLLDLHQYERRHAAVLVALIVAASLWKGFDLWLSAVPGAPGSALAWGYLSAPLGLIVWCAVWAIGSMLFQRRFAFWAHLHVALAWLLVAMIAEEVSRQLAFALSAPLIEKAGRLVFVGAVAMMMWRHMGLLLPARRRAFAIAIGSAVVVGGGLLLADRWVQQEPLVGDLYLGTISLPGVRVARPVSIDAFVKSAAPLQQTLSKWAKPGDDDDSPGGDDD